MVNQEPNINLGQDGIWRPAAEKKVNGEADSPAEIATQAAMVGPIAEIWDAPEEDEAWAHLSGLTHEPV